MSREEEDKSIDAISIIDSSSVLEIRFITAYTGHPPPPYVKEIVARLGSGSARVCVRVKYRSFLESEPPPCREMFGQMAAVDHQKPNLRSFLSVKRSHALDCFFLSAVATGSPCPLSGCMFPSEFRTSSLCTTVGENMPPSKEVGGMRLKDRTTEGEETYRNQTAYK